jgi:branched-subunit amino acid transport protein
MPAEWLWLIVLGCGAATFVWRGAGVLLVRRIDADGAFFRWITCVSYAMLAGLIFRMLLMPESELASVPLWLRCAAIAIAFAAYFVAGKRLAAGVLAGGVSLTVLLSVTG